MAAVLRCGEGAALSHRSAGALWRICGEIHGEIHVSIPYARNVREPGLVMHRRLSLSAGDVTDNEHIPVTTPAATLIDLASELTDRDLEAAINEADQRDLLSPQALIAAVEQASRRPGIGRLRAMLAKQHFRLSQSELERLFLRLIKKRRLPVPETQVWINGYRVDFFWPDLGIVVEADSGRYHRTAAQQTRDRERDHAHLCAGLVPLRFTHAQIAFRERYVGGVIQTAARRS